MSTLKTTNQNLLQNEIYKHVTKTLNPYKLYILTCLKHNLVVVMISNVTRYINAVCYYNLRF